MLNVTVIKIQIQILKGQNTHPSTYYPIKRHWKALLQ